ncbi:uncharacterized protein Z519_08238 [Cladophialophora bantiana CBS 173.52]|uniref:Major facilitator superfamily (MFS) profile domain-containing protein n=1 Tax=Cladophialophora bantiana (strain ATCC 10958 / CBS 173.52 / CDC B-1940 / NIH 8579) TaxID=1442370 RepID=A0A0D2FXZ1_CLAB1|nr:uncharacterized protein Z519_08238 [Cladophialophora bantiana CBS 173.52]KIW91342.1 hypothetical protein Z519_08238 [Cladophialophora bantiana CBS 173.52]
MAIPEEARIEDSEISLDDSENSNTADHNNESPDRTAQSGVRDIEATTVVWTTKALIFAYVMLWITYFVEGMLGGVTAALNPYVTSAFALHSLTPTVGVLSSVIGGVTNLTLAKILDVFGRPQGYLFCVSLATIGLIMMAACNNVESYAAAQVFYTVGNNGLQYSLSVFVADTSKLRNRGLMQAIVSTPNLITCWLAGPISTGFLNGPGWRWAFGMFTILVPAVTLPLWGLLLKNYFKAKKLGLISKINNQRNPLQSTLHYCREFDAIGLLLMSAGFALFLLPFDLYTLQAKGWDSALVISMLVLGVVLIITFVIWEKFFVSTTFMPYSLLLDRTVFGACILSATLFISYYCWASFLSSFLQVVNGLSVSDASYVQQTYTVCSVLCSVGVGAFIHYTGRFKPVCLFVGMPLSILGIGLMINFLGPSGNIGYIVMCQIFISVGSGIVVICDEIAILAATSHQHTAVCIAVLSMFASVGGAIGLTIASAIWQDTFPKKLADYLPAKDLPNLLLIYTDLSTQLSYPMGSDTRLAIQRAYADAQKMLLTAGTAVWVAGVIGVLMWRNINVIGIQQTKGHVW